MILSSLVNPDPGGFVELNKNLAAHIGAENVNAFHEEAGNATIHEMLTNATITKELTKDAPIMGEINLAVGNIHSKAFGLGRARQSDEHVTALTKSVFSLAAGENVGTLRNVVAAELLSNPVINDAIVRNPTVMKELNATITRLYEARKKSHK